MFLDTICNHRSTEPVWFRFFRGFFAITLTGIIIYYAIVQYQKIGTEASIAVKFERTSGYRLNMIICTSVELFTEFHGYNNAKTINGRAYFISYNPIIVSYEDEFFGVLRYVLELNPQLEQLPIQLKSNEVHVEVSSHPYSGFARFETTRKYNHTDLISNLGGFYGAIAGIFILFFGMQRHEPWGLTQKYLFSCTHCRKSLKRNFARKYVSTAGIPLVEKVDKRPEGSSLEERVQILETLLRDYYLDDYYLKKVKDVRINHKRFLKKYEEINRQDNENIENTELNASLV
ncbi:unnamed protein product [Rhizophagus irregularis]|nr:unnamed protein product [Rhizophagus irregularis]